MQKEILFKQDSNGVLADVMLPCEAFELPLIHGVAQSDKTPNTKNTMQEKGADFSEDKKHRYRLWRVWDRTLPKAMCIGLNPSNANAEKNDPTINHLIAVLTRLGFGGFYMTNCYSYVSSDPKVLYTKEASIESEEINWRWLQKTAIDCDDIIFAWGGFKVVQELQTDKIIADMFPLAKCFGKNKDGSPMHPMGLMYSGKLTTAGLISYSAVSPCIKGNSNGA